MELDDNAAAAALEVSIEDLFQNPPKRDRALPAPYLLQVFRKPEIMPKLRNCSGS